MALDSVWKTMAAVPAIDPELKQDGSRIGDFTILWKLGRGEFGEVKACQPYTEKGSKKTDGKSQKGAELALKTIDKSQIPSTNIKKAIRLIQRINLEVEAMRTLSDHPNICGLHSCMQTAESVHIVMDRGEIDLYEFFDDGMAENDVRVIMKQLLSAIAFCHQNAFAHRDLKPENVLVKPRDGNRKAYHVLLCDFGLCAKMSTTGWKLSDFVGSPGFYAPEMLAEAEPYDGRKVDVWSIGAVFLEMLLGHNDFHDLWITVYHEKKLSQQNAKYLQGRMDESLPGLNKQLRYLKVSENCRDSLLKGMLMTLPEHRCTADEVLTSPFFQEEVSEKKPETKKSVKASPLSSFRTPGSSIAANASAAADHMRGLFPSAEPAMSSAAADHMRDLFPSEPTPAAKAADDGSAAADHVRGLFPTSGPTAGPADHARGLFPGGVISSSPISDEARSRLRGSTCVEAKTPTGPQPPSEGETSSETDANETAKMEVVKDLFSDPIGVPTDTDEEEAVESPRAAQKRALQANKAKMSARKKSISALASPSMMAKKTPKSTGGTALKTVDDSALSLVKGGSHTSAEGSTYGFTTGATERRADRKKSINMVGKRLEAHAFNKMVVQRRDSGKISYAEVMRVTGVMDPKSSREL